MEAFSKRKSNGLQEVLIFMYVNMKSTFCTEQR